MVIKWSWPRQAKKLRVKVRPLKLEGLNACCKKNEDGLVVVKLKWNGPKSGLVPFRRVSTCQRSYTAHKLLKKGELLCVEWDDEFESNCDFFIGSSKDGSFCSWNVSFHVLYGEDAESKTKLVLLGKVSLNIAEFASKMDSQVEKRIPVSLQIDGAVTEANLLISLSFVEVRNSNETNDFPGTASNSTSFSELEELSVFNSLADGSIDHNEELSGELEQSTSTETRLDPASKAGLFSWKKRKLNFGLSKKKAKPLVDLDNHGPAQEEKDITSNWEVKELVSRDGKAKLRTNVFFASYDQRSEKAAGESACTALVVIIAHWLQSNQNLMPSTSQFDSLITEGSSLWRKLCDSNAYTDAFPDKHFDLDTVIKADLRPVTIMHDHSFTGMFSPDKFENSKGSFMAFDDIWEEINGCTDVYDLPNIYIVSWNDHFFVLKVEADAYYIIDSLGERLFEGCNQAYILKFDNSSLMSEKVTKETEGSEEASEAESSKEEEIYEETCKGKNCCREFIKRFLAAVLLGELEEEEKKRPVSFVSLLQRLQIDFNYCSSSSASSSSSSLSSATSSLFPGEG